MYSNIKEKVFRHIDFYGLPYSCFEIKPKQVKEFILDSLERPSEIKKFIDYSLKFKPDVAKDDNFIELIIKTATGLLDQQYAIQHKVKDERLLMKINDILTTDRFSTSAYLERIM